MIDKPRANPAGGARRRVAASVRAMPLALVQDGERVRVVSLHGRSRDMEELIAAGLSVNRFLDVVNRQSGGGILVRLDQRRYAIGAGLSQAIWVRQVETTPAPDPAVSSHQLIMSRNLTASPSLPPQQETALPTASSREPRVGAVPITQTAGQGLFRVSGLLASGALAQHLNDLGIHVGGHLSILQDQGPAGTVVACGDARIALSPEMSGKILVTPIVGGRP